MPELSCAEAAAGVAAGSLPERLTSGDTGAANIAIFVEIGQIRVVKTVVRRGSGGTENRPGGAEKTVSTLEKTKVLTENSKVLTVFSKVLTVSIAAGEGECSPFLTGRTGTAERCVARCSLAGYAGMTFAGCGLVAARKGSGLFRRTGSLQDEAGMPVSVLCFFTKILYDFLPGGFVR